MFISLRDECYKQDITAIGDTKVLGIQLNYILLGKPRELSCGADISDRSILMV